MRAKSADVNQAVWLHPLINLDPKEAALNQNRVTSLHFCKPPTHIETPNTNTSQTFIKQVNNNSCIVRTLF